MGSRTVVMLNNDFSDEWANDPKLGYKIRNASYSIDMPPNSLGKYGAVVECANADIQTLVRVDGYTGFDRVAGKFRGFGPSNDEDMLDLIKHAADKFGYRLVRKHKSSTN